MVVTWRQRINPLWWFGNIDEPIPPYNKWRGLPYFIRKILWFLRNPFHNFMFYVVGITDKPFIVRGEYPSDVFNPNGGWKHHFVIYNRLRLPFVSYVGKIKFYIGWRERGNLGFKLTTGGK